MGGHFRFFSWILIKLSLLLLLFSQLFLLRLGQPGSWFRSDDFNLEWVSLIFILLLLLLNHICFLLIPSLLPFLSLLMPPLCFLQIGLFLILGHLFGVFSMSRVVINVRLGSGLDFGV